MAVGFYDMIAIFSGTSEERMKHLQGPGKDKGLPFLGLFATVWL